MRQSVSAPGRFALAGLFATIPRLTVSITLHGMDYDTRAPRTFYAITHKRDLDAFVPVPPLLAHRGWRALANDVRFSMRADGFQVGFLSRIVKKPVWFSRALRPLNVGVVLERVGVHPLDSLHLRPAETWIREALAEEGDAPIGEVLAFATIQTLAAQTGQTYERLAARPLSALLAWRYFPLLQVQAGAEIFAPAAHRRAELRVLATAKRQLADCVEWLERGGSLYTSPEGRLSPDGRISPCRAGLTRVLRDAPADTRVQPIAIVYDFMVTGRLRMWIDLAPAIEDGTALTHHELERRLRAAWMSVARFTCTQLASGLLVNRQEQGQRATTIRDLEAEVLVWARELAAAGRQVDPQLLTEAGVHRRLADYLAYAELHGIIRQYSGSIALAPGQPGEIAVIPGDVGYRDWPLRYAANEAQEMAGAAPAQTDTLAM